jgi:hypothetical protein
VSFPVYRLTNKKPLSSQGVLYYSNSYLDVDSNTVSTNIKIVDNTEEPWPTLNRRRLCMSSKGVPLYPLRIAIYFLGDFIKIAKKGWWFIDSLGKIFTYTKSVSVKLKFFKIRRVIPSKSTGSIVEVQNLAERFKTLFTVNKDSKYAGILEYRGIHILYGVYTEEHKSTRRMI